MDGRGRPTEDRVLITQLLPSLHMFAVFDGHSGSGAVRLTMELLPKRLEAALKMRSLTSPSDLVHVLRTAFLEHDKELARQMSRTRDSGTTASVVLVTDTHCIVCFIGDSPICMFDPASGLILKEAGKHEPTLATETERIRQAGGTVEVDEYGTPRVNGSLMVSRAFGDFSLKFDTDQPIPESADWSKFAVTAEPEVVVWERPEQGVLAIMSDGMVETDTSALKPLSLVAKELQMAIKSTELNLPRAAEAATTAHVAAATRGRRPNTYDGDDLSLILVDIGRRAANTTPTAGGGSALVNTIQTLLSKPKTRRARGGRRNKTGKKNRLIKIVTL